jgi:hypothetical protein
VIDVVSSFLFYANGNEVLTIRDQATNNV